MQVHVLPNEAGGPKSVEITDGTETLTMSVHRDRWGTWGDLRTADGTRSWNHASLAEINLLILRAREAVTVSELLAGLGDCDQKRIAELAK